jgi:HSP20 family protein
MTVRELLHIGKSPISVARGGNPIATFQDEVNRLFGDFFGESHLPSWPQLRTAAASAFTVTPALDVSETAKEFKISAELPGMDSKDVQITVADGYVTLRGEKRQESKEEKEGYFRQERSYGTFQRVISLPETANMEKAEASFKNGLLTVSIPKNAATINKTRTLEVKNVA